MKFSLQNQNENIISRSKPQKCVCDFVAIIFLIHDLPLGIFVYIDYNNNLCKQYLLYNFYDSIFPFTSLDIQSLGKVYSTLVKLYPVL